MNKKRIDISKSWRIRNEAIETMKLAHSYNFITSLTSPIIIHLAVYVTSAVALAISLTQEIEIITLS